MNYGDFPLEETIHVFFTTRAFATGIPGTLSAATVAVYEDITATPIQTSVAVTETLNSIAGLNAVPIVATAANGYEVGKNYHVVIEAGTVDSVSVVGEVVAYFSIGRSAAAVDLANGTDGLGAIKAETAAIVNDTDLIDDGTSGLAKIATDVAAILVDTDVIDDGTSGLVKIASDVAAVLVDTGTDGVVLAANAITEAKIADNAIATEHIATGAISADSLAADTITAAKVAADVHAEAADVVWDEAVSGHISSGSMGRALQIAGVVLAETTASGTPTTTTLPLTAGSAVDNFYNDMQIIPLSGNLAGQTRVITDYDGGTTTITVDEPWTSAIANGDAVIIKADHTHSTSQLAAAIWDEDATGHQTGGTFGQAIGDPGANTETMYDAVVTDAAGTNVAADVIAVKVDTAATLVDTAEIGTAGAGLTDLGGMSTGMKGEVNAEVDTALATTTYAEPTGVPPSTDSLSDKIGFIYMALRNKVLVSATKKQFHDDAGNVEWEKDLSDDATDYIETEANAP